MRLLFEFVDQNSKDQFFCPGGLNGFVLFAGQDVELVAEDQDLEILIC